MQKVMPIDFPILAAKNTHIFRVILRISLLAQRVLESGAYAVGRHKHFYTDRFILSLCCLLSPNSEKIRITSILIPCYQYITDNIRAHSSKPNLVLY